MFVYTNFSSYRAISQNHVTGSPGNGSRREPSRIPTLFGPETTRSAQAPRMSTFLPDLTTYAFPGNTEENKQLRTLCGSYLVATFMGILYSG